MIAPELAQAFLQELDTASSVLIGTHLNPDGDALGSALAVSFLLDSRGIKNEVVCHHPPPRNLQFLPGVSRIRQEPSETAHDLGIVVDLDSLERLGSTEPFFTQCRRTVFIDHHIPHEAPGDLRIVDTTAAATALILTHLFRLMKVVVSAEMATCLLTGIVTDTGSFRFRNTTADALSSSAELVECGGDITRVAEEIFQYKPLASSKLLGIVLNNIHMEMDGRLAWSALSFQDFERCQARDEDTEGFVNELLSIETVQISALLREAKEGKTRCSLRSRGSFDVSEVARVFGGGGHRNAAGCTFDSGPAEASQLLVTEMRKCLASS